MKRFGKIKTFKNFIGNLLGIKKKTVEEKLYKKPNQINERKKMNDNIEAE